MGAGAVRLPGITVGWNALIGAGAVVVADVPDNPVVVGNLARMVRLLHEIAAYTLAEGRIGK